ncbi:MAG: PEP-CTERM sorting domain-containing protein [Candidatus Omnitrophica bacterium]|nr:PEP-CTERM sorting domain-containing protein [Candidatus Omnitrophota bacterium]
MKKISIVLVMLFILVSTCSAFAAEYISTVNAAGDAVWYQDSGGGSNYKGWNPQSENIGTYYYSYYSSGSGTWTYNETTYLQVALPGISASETISSAALWINMTGLTKGLPSGAANMYHAANAVSANGIATQKIAGSEFVLNFKDQSTGLLGIDVTNFIVSDYTNSQAFAAFNFNFKGYGTDGPLSAMSFKSGSSTLAPYLKITTTAAPEPASMVLFSIGGVALAFARKRKKKA